MRLTDLFSDWPTRTERRIRNRVPLTHDLYMASIPTRLRLSHIRKQLGPAAGEHEAKLMAFYLGQIEGDVRQAPSI